MYVHSFPRSIRIFLFKLVKITRTHSSYPNLHGKVRMTSHTTKHFTHCTYASILWGLLKALMCQICICRLTTLCAIHGDRYAKAMLRISANTKKWPQLYFNNWWKAKNFRFNIYMGLHCPSAQNKSDQEPFPVIKAVVTKIVDIDGYTKYI